MLNIKNSRASCPKNPLAAEGILMLREHVCHKPKNWVIIKLFHERYPRIKSGDPSSGISFSRYRGYVVFMMEFTKLTSVTLKVGQSDRVWWYRGNIMYMMQLTKLTSVTLKVGQGDPYTIPSSFSMRGTYTPRLMILAHFLLKILG
jgi:hypothetical protein